MVYGDLKPENLLLHASGHLKLADFGSARLADDPDPAHPLTIANLQDHPAPGGSTTATAPGAGSAASGVDSGRVEGTSEYVSPECVAGAPASQASDLWALGCCLYQLLAGRAPVWAGTETEAGGLAEVAGAGDSCADSAEARFAQAERERKAVFAKIVTFEAGEERFPPGFPPHARDLCQRLLQRDPAARLGVCVAEPPTDLSPTGPARLVVRHDAIERHPFFAGVDWASLHTQPAPLLEVVSTRLDVCV